MNVLGEAIGEICKAVLPIPEESYRGDPDSAVAVCTLSSMDLLKKFPDSEILDSISIAGRLLSENKGIDSIIKHVNKNQKIKTVIVCGREVWGHRAGHSLFELYKNGVDKNNRIVGSTSHDPHLASSEPQIRYFQDAVTLVDMMGQTDFEKISDKIRSSIRLSASPG